MVEEKRKVMYCIAAEPSYLYIQTMFGHAWCLKGTRDIMEAAIKAPSNWFDTGYPGRYKRDPDGHCRTG